MKKQIKLSNKEVLKRSLEDFSLYVKSMIIDLQRLADDTQNKLDNLDFAMQKFEEAINGEKKNEN